MLKMIIPLEKLISKWLKIDDGEINGFGIDENGVEYAKKSGKLFKLRKSKRKKRLSFKIWLSQEKSCQKVGIQLISMLWRTDQSF